MLGISNTALAKYAKGGPLNLNKHVNLDNCELNPISHGGGGLGGPPLAEIIIMQYFAYKT